VTARDVRHDCAGRERLRYQSALLLLAPAPPPLFPGDDLNTLDQRSLLTDTIGASAFSSPITHMPARRPSPDGYPSVKGSRMPAAARSAPPFQAAGVREPLTNPDMHLRTTEPERALALAFQSLALSLTPDRPNTIGASRKRWATYRASGFERIAEESRADVARLWSVSMRPTCNQAHVAFLR
jgi:hypothetical protein